MSDSESAIESSSPNRFHDCAARASRFMRSFKIVSERDLWPTLHNLHTEEHILACDAKCLSGPTPVGGCVHPKKTFLSTRNSRRSTHVFLFWFYLFGGSSHITDDMLKGTVRKILRPVCPLGLNECNGHAKTPGQQVCINPFHYKLVEPQVIIDILVKHGLLATRITARFRLADVRQFCSEFHKALPRLDCDHEAFNVPASAIESDAPQWLDANDSQLPALESAVMHQGISRDAAASAYPAGIPAAVVPTLVPPPPRVPVVRPIQYLLLPPGTQVIPYWQQYSSDPRMVGASNLLNVDPQQQGGVLPNNIAEPAWPDTALPQVVPQVGLRMQEKRKTPAGPQDSDNDSDNIEEWDLNAAALVDIKRPRIEKPRSSFSQLHDLACAAAALEPVHISTA